MGFDIDRTIRNLKPEKWTGPLVCRPPADLVSGSAAATKRHLMPDTTVYVHAGQGKLPSHIASILQQWPLLHCSVALGEIAHGIGRLDPSHPKTPDRRNYLESVLRHVPQHRVVTPEDGTHVSAGILTGILAQLLGLPNGGHRQRINDALILLSARKSGAAVLTANVGDFDLLQQLMPSAEVVYYSV